MKKITFVRFVFSIILFTVFVAEAQVTLESETHITDLAMYFTGIKDQNSTRQSETEPYDYAYGRALSPHGDCIKTYKQYVFMTWYRGGKLDRHMMLTRYNTDTGTMKTIEFPHQHTGFKGKWWIGETHNTIAIGISPINGTIHMVFDMHAYTNSGAFVNDYFRYTYSVSGAAELPDEDFTLDKFVKDPIDNDYRHCTMDGVRDPAHYDRFTYPNFFLNDQDELFLTARDGTSHDGAQAFIKYNSTTEKWGRFKYFNALGAGSKGETHNWSIYGNIKYVDGKIRIGFQRRLNTGADKYQYQNGVYYAYSDDPTGASQWKNHKGENMTLPLVKAEEVLVYEPGDYVETTQQNKVHIVGNFDWTVTDNGDVHIISRVKDNENNVTKYIHSYKPNGVSEFIISEDFGGAEALYTSGDDVFVIGLNSSGRPFIDRAEGGTNSFTRVYEQTSGKRFRKGKVHISDGKLYYYLLENNTADSDETQPTYLQVIDLDVQEGLKPFAVNLLTPTDNQSFQEGENVQLYATATADTGEITKVEFLVNGAIVSEDTTKPYLFDWTPSAIGSYTIKAVAFKTGGANITSSEVTIEVLEIDKSDLTNDVYRMRNVATGKFLGDEGGSAVPVSMNDDGETQNRHWSFEKVNVNGIDFFNIKSETNGILRATGPNYEDSEGNPKPYYVLSTGRPTGDIANDKIWTIHYNESDDTFRFESKDNDRYLYHDANGHVSNISVDETNADELNRTKWEAISTSESLSIADEVLRSPSIKIYPNPARDKFTIAFQNINTIERVEIYNILGKRVYQNAISKSKLEIESSGFTAGVYIVKAFSDINKEYYTKLVIK
ncbi:BNR-4 repeat-containing protein [Hyunsoonleella sp. SJ7]|uniref:BNR-4 repeat-containing protein n=1 Tax=Hyunsoonleella aquatilis TaxID=2762758 RepID=A0A923HEC5_9FLAO|nr:BNR-4 repeat-containing protein [Hyunsoonleella aquatilis]MBC3758668.1 BNR-4 repeat-containing protein [Hyunsoonleella aquatilis]